MKSPAVILTSEFELPKNSKEFGAYVDYLSREGASEFKEKAVDDSLTKESDFIIQQDILAENNQEHFSEYLDYMSRKGALEQKKKLTLDEQLNLDYLTKESPKMQELFTNLFYSKENDPSLMKTGLFTADKLDLTKKEKADFKKRVNENQKNGSILFKDVFSMDTNFLIEQGIYDPKSNILDRERLILACRKSMNTLFEKEGLTHTAEWIGEIHYNTKHFHIHIATTEIKNTRKLEIKKKDGTYLKEPRGKRKLSSLKAMKSVFTNELISHDTELEKITLLRNKLVADIKKEVQSENILIKKKLLDLYKSLPENKKKWNYKNLSNNNKLALNGIIDLSMNQNPSFLEYKKAIYDESKYRNSLYNKNDKQGDYYFNKLYGEEGIYKRLGNSILKEIKIIEQKEEELEVQLRKKIVDNSNLIQSNLESFSKNNQSAIQRQFPNATCVRNQNNWIKEGRGILNETLPIYIKIPSFELDSQGFPTKKISGYESVPVYDVLQTFPIKLSEEKNPVSQFKYSNLSMEKNHFKPNIEKFSIKNQKNILNDLPTATHVKSDLEWIGEKRIVIDYDNPLIIYVPDQIDEKGKPHFKSVPIYDFSQTVSFDELKKRPELQKLLQLDKQTVNQYLSEQTKRYNKAGKSNNIQDYYEQQSSTQFYPSGLKKIANAIDNEWDRIKNEREYEKVQYISNQAKQQQELGLE